MSDAANTAAQAPAAAQAPVVTSPSAEPAPSPREAVIRRENREAPKKLSEKRRLNHNFDAEAWARAGEKVKAAELGEDASKAAVPAKPGTPAKGPDGKFLPRKSEPAVQKRTAAKEAPAEAAKPDPFGKPEPETASDDTAEDVAEQTPAEVSTDPATKRKQLEALAAELGFKIDAKAVTAADRYQLREEQRRRQAAVDAKLQAERAGFEKERAAVLERGKKYEAFLKALEAGDPDGMAQAVDRADWNAIQEETLARIANPEYNEIQRLRKELDEDKANRAKAEEEHRARAEQHARMQAANAVRQGIREQAAQAKDPLLKAMHSDGLFVETLFNIQKANYDEVTQTTLSLEEALDERMPNGVTLRETMHGLYKNLAAAFGQPAPLPAPVPVAAAKPTPAPRRERTPAPPPSQVAAPARPLTAEARFRERAARDAERIERFSKAMNPALR